MTPIETERLRIARLLDVHETKVRALKARLAEVLRLEEAGDVEGIRLLVEDRKFWESKMPPPLNDRQLVELIFLPMALIDVIENGQFDKDNAEFKRAQTLLWTSVRLVLMSLDKTKQAKLLRRAKRTHDAVLSVYQKEGASVAKVGLLIFYIVQAAAECDYLVLDPARRSTKP